MRKIKIKSLIVALIIGFFIIISSPYIPQRINNLVKLGFECIIIIILLAQKTVNKKGLYTAIPAFLFLLVSLFSTFRWSVFSLRVLNAFVTNLAIVLFYYLFFIINKKIERNNILKVVQRCFIFIAIIMDFFAVVTLGKGLGGLGEPVYLLGNKFMLSYIHMVILSFLICDKSNSKLKIISYYIFSIIMFRIVDTMTGVIGITVVLLILLISEKKNRIINVLSNPKTLLITFFSINAIFLLSNIVFSNQIISSFLLKYSHTDTLLSGRLPMYNLVMNEIKKSPLFGFGINYDIVLAKFGFGNPQNGLLKMLLDYGIIGTFMFSLLLYNTFKNLTKCNDKSFVLFIVVFVYGMIACSLVEINLDLIFMFIIAIGNGLSFSTYNELTKESKI